ncbi:hypothetical protein BX666DRAFT_1145203 [Dichotomocladium elegans]|nr:hypothetical protein BX666DRAFT_1145203 [Dichotomocladium elegans]
MQPASIHGPTEGASVSAGGIFGDKERATENVWARQVEAEKMKKLRAIMEEQKKTTGGSTKEADRTSKSLLK